MLQDEGREIELVVLVLCMSDEEPEQNRTWVAEVFRQKKAGGT